MCCRSRTRMNTLTFKMGGFAAWRCTSSLVDIISHIIAHNKSITSQHLELFQFLPVAVMKFILPFLVLAATSIAAPQNAAPPSFRIKNVISGGSGCPQGSIDVSWTDSKVLPICTSPSLSPPPQTYPTLTPLPLPRLRQVLRRPHRPKNRHNRVAQKLPNRPNPLLHPGLLARPP